MYGGPQPLTDEQKKQHQEITNQTLRTAALLAGALWVTPIIFHFVQKQLK